MTPEEAQIGLAVRRAAIRFADEHKGQCDQQPCALSVEYCSEHQTARVTCTGCEESADYDVEFTWEFDGSQGKTKKCPN